MHICCLHTARQIDATHYAPETRRNNSPESIYDLYNNQVSNVFEDNKPFTMLPGKLL